MRLAKNPACAIKQYGWLGRCRLRGLHELTRRACTGVNVALHPALDRSSPARKDRRTVGDTDSRWNIVELDIV